MRHAHLLSCLTIASAMAAALTAGDADAVLRTRFWYANATSYCQTALPVFDGNIRKRPLAVQNEGRVPAFVTCSFAAQNTPLDSVTVFAFNGSDATVSFKCTGVTGGAGSASNQYVVKTVSIPASDRDGLAWIPADFGGAATIPGSGYFSVSCVLPPGLGINDSVVVFVEDVGI